MALREGKISIELQIQRTAATVRDCNTRAYCGSRLLQSPRLQFYTATNAMKYSCNSLRIQTQLVENSLRAFGNRVTYIKQILVLSKHNNFEAIVLRGGSVSHKIWPRRLGNILHWTDSREFCAPRMMPERLLATCRKKNELLLAVLAFFI